MAATKIVDPDDLTQNQEVLITPIDATATLASSGTIKLMQTWNGTTGLSLSAGLSVQSMYSFLKEEWRTDATLIRYPFPMIAITDESFELQNGWDLDKANKGRPSWKFLRDGGWALKNPDGVSKEELMNVTTLGAFNDSLADRAYYLPSELGFAASAGFDPMVFDLYSTPTSALEPSGFRFAGEVNEAVKVFGASGGYGDYDFRDNFVIYLREQGKTHASYDLLTEQGIAALTYKKYAMPLSNALDPKITNVDSLVGNKVGGPYKDIDISYFTTKQSWQIGATNYNFHVIIDGNEKSAEEIYEKVQYLLRQSDVINSQASSATYPVYGNTADGLLHFVGDTLYTDYVDGWGGVYIDNYDPDDINRLIFEDDTQVERQFPFTATGSLLFNPNLVSDTGDGGDPDLRTSHALYWMFHKSIPNTHGVPPSAYGTSNAWLVRDSNGKAISGACSAASLSYTFDYDTDDTGRESGVEHGRTPKTDAPVVVVAIGLSTAQFVQVDFDSPGIERKTGNNISVVAALERNYSNPA